MKKGVVALLLALALIVLVSPGIVGRIAEKSMDENLDWAANESQELVVSSQGFDRGWFSSAGQHRVEIRDGELQDFFLVVAGSAGAGELPALIIDTRLDHGLIPLASMSRDEGTLMPGLGSAISTLSVELADGEIVRLPGVIYSDVGLTGELRSRFELGAGAHHFDGANVEWGDTTIEVTTDPATGEIWFDGGLGSVSLGGDGELFSVTDLGFTGKQRQSRFGFAVGDVDIGMQSMTVEDYTGETTTIGPMTVVASSAVKDDRVTGRLSFELDNAPFADFGLANIVADIVLIDADGVAIGNITDALDKLQDDGSTEDFMFVVEDDLQRLLAAGAELRFDRLDISLPQGDANAKLRFAVSESNANTFTWTSVLLALDASVELSLPAELVDLMTTMDPQMHAAIAGGFLRKNGDVYEMEAAFQKGLLTVNGAPMPIPIPGTQ